MQISSEDYDHLNRTVGQNFMPSTGLVALYYFLTSEKFRHYETSIIGFSWEGWSGHNWKREADLVEEWISKGKLRQLNF